MRGKYFKLGMVSNRHRVVTYVFLTWNLKAFFSNQLINIWNTTRTRDTVHTRTLCTAEERDYIALETDSEEFIALYDLLCQILFQIIWRHQKLKAEEPLSIMEISFESYLWEWCLTEIWQLWCLSYLEIKLKYLNKQLYYSM